MTGGPADWAGNVTAERALTVASAAGFSWHYPTLWQSTLLVVPPGYSTLEVVFLDTVTLTGSMTRRHLSDFNTVQTPPPESELQWAWVEAQLSACQADWLVVIGNEPLYSALQPGASAVLQTRLLPLLNASGAALYVGGRDEVAQHFRPTAAAPTVDSIVVGNGAGFDAAAAAALPNAAGTPPGALAWSYGGSAGFATLTVAVATAGYAQLTVRFYGEGAGAPPLYSFSKNATRVGTLQEVPPALGLHGAHSGLLLLLILAGGTAAACGYVVSSALHPPPAVTDAQPPPKVARRRPTDSERAPLLEPGLTEAERAKRFSTHFL